MATGTGSAGRYGARYGRRIRKLVTKIESRQKSASNCPSCLKPGVKRLASGIWLCRKCGTKFAGKAYFPE